MPALRRAALLLPYVYMHTCTAIPVESLPACIVARAGPRAPLGRALCGGSGGSNGRGPVASDERAEGLDGGRDSATREGGRESVKGLLAPALQRHGVGSRQAAVSAMRVCNTAGQEEVVEGPMAPDPPEDEPEPGPRCCAE